MYNSIPKKFLVTDLRIKKDFNKKTFNGYKKNQVFSEFQKNILSGNIEKSILWCSELHCSGYLTQIYDKLLSIYLKEINKSNLKLIPIFLHNYKILIKKTEKCKDLLFLRNDQFFRNNINDLVCLITFSTKYKLPKLPTITSEDFNMDNNKNKMLSQNLNYIQQFIKENDNKNIIIPLSEIALNLKKIGLSKSLENILFWLSWIMTYEKNFHKGYINCHSRKQTNVNLKFYNDYVWIIWELVMDISDNEYIKYLYELFKLDFTKSKKRRKIDLLIIAFIIIIDPQPKIDFNKSLIDSDKNKIRIKIISNINFQYLDIVLNNDPEILKKKLESYVTKNKIESPFYSKESFKNNHDYLNKTTEKFIPKERIIKNSNTKINHSTKIKTNNNNNNINTKNDNMNTKNDIPYYFNKQSMSSAVIINNVNDNEFTRYLKPNTNIINNKTYTRIPNCDINYINSPSPVNTFSLKKIVKNMNDQFNNII